MIGAYTQLYWKLHVLDFKIAAPLRFHFVCSLIGYFFLISWPVYINNSVGRP